MEAFGRYRLLKRLAAGGMGEIFLARSASLDGFEKDLVIKRVLTMHGDREHFVSMFLDEARISMLLTHHNIVQVFDFGEAEGRYYVLLKPFDPARLLALVLQLARVADMKRAVSRLTTAIRRKPRP